MSDPVHPDLPVSGAQVAFAVREEMARTVDDVLARRTRSILLDARAARGAAPAVAELMADELDRDEGWVEEQVAAFRAIAAGYVIG
jgi:glycerol-3-phosphate dehydrogenase